MSKRQRTCSPSIPQTPWEKILAKWKQIIDAQNTHHLEPLTTNIGRVAMRFILEEMFVCIDKMPTQGQNSTVYNVKIYGRPRPANTLKEGILKVFAPTLKEFVLDGPLEAEMQRYSAEYKLAPQVLAVNGQAMISQKCQTASFTNPISCLSTNIYPILRQLDREKYRITNSMLQYSKPEYKRRQILTFALNMYSQIGMFNTDPNENNYMFINNKLVQIDYGANRFHKEEDFKNFFNRLDSTKMDETHCRKALMISEDIKCPPFYYWADYFGYAEEDKKSFTQQQWEDWLEEKEKEFEGYCKALNERIEKISGSVKVHTRGSVKQVIF